MTQVLFLREDRNSRWLRWREDCASVRRFWTVGLVLIPFAVASVLGGQALGLPLRLYGDIAAIFALPLTMFVVSVGVMWPLHFLPRWWKLTPEKVSGDRWQDVIEWALMTDAVDPAYYRVSVRASDGRAPAYIRVAEAEVPIRTVEEYFLCHAGSHRRVHTHSETFTERILRHALGESRVGAEQRHVADARKDARR